MNLRLAKQKPKHVLLVEDEFLVAVDAEDTICSPDISLTIAESVQSAMRILDTGRIDYAIVDFKLGSENSLPVISRLKQMGTPFAIVSGENVTELQRCLSDRHVVYRKPVDYGWVMKQLTA